MKLTKNDCQSCCNTISYFSFQQDSTNYQICKNQEQVAEYKTLISYLEKNSVFQELFRNDSDDSGNSTQAALAFYIESKKQLDRTSVQQIAIIQQNDLLDTVGKIWAEHLDPQESYKRTTWLLDDLIYLMYQTVLQYKLLTDVNNKSLIARQLKNLENCQILSKMSKDSEEPISIGGIHKSYLPDWFFKHFPDHVPILLRNPNP